MTSSQIKVILNRIGIDVSTENVIEQNTIRTLILPSNQGIDTRTDHICIDLNNNLIKIKKKKAILAAGRIGKFEYGDANKTWIKSVDSSFLLSHKSLKYKYPEKDGYLFTINKETGETVKSYLIVSASRNYIECKSEIKIDINNEYVCYCSAEDYPLLVQNPFDYSEFLKYIDYTDNKYDIYLDINQLVGIEFISEKVGNS